MKSSREGGHEHGMRTPLRPVQLPEPLGFWPATTPKSGTSDGSTPPAAGAAAAGAAGAAGAGAAGAGVSGSAWTAATCAPNVVAAWGQPTPGPWMFWSVTVAALRRASWDALELSSGKVSLTEGLLITNPAFTFWLRREMNELRSGGHVQGILIGWPLGPLIPSQSLCVAACQYERLDMNSNMERALTQCR